MKDFQNISNYEDYLINKSGEIYSLKVGRLLKGSCRKGYVRVTLRKDNRTSQFSVHRLVWETFKGEIPERLEINHIDGNKKNNRLTNLELVTRSENISHAYATGLIPDRRGSLNSNAKLDIESRNYIIAEKKRGTSTRVLAEKFKVNLSTITRIYSKGY